MDSLPLVGQGNLTLSSAILGVAIVYFVVAPLIRTIHNLTTHPLALANIPGRKTWAASRIPYLLSLVRGELVHDIEDMHRKYGPIVRTAPDEVSFADPAAWNDILLAKFPKDKVWWSPVGGAAPGLTTAVDEDEHALIRRVMAPSFTSRTLSAQEDIVHTYADLLVQRWKEIISSTGKGELDILRWFNFFTFDVFGAFAFGESFDCLLKSQYHRWISIIFDQLKFNGAMIAVRFYPAIDKLLLKFIPPSLERAKQEHVGIISDKVQRRLKKGSEKMDMMSSVEGGKGGETKLPMEVVYSTFADFAVAASDTTAMSLSAGVNFLVQNPEKMGRLVGEVRGRFKAYEEITAQGVKELRYLNAVLQEVLRLAPPVPWMPPRKVPKGGKSVCGKVLPGGTSVSITFTSMHRNPESFHDSDSFHPERWLPEATTNPKSPFYNDKRHAWQPFALGPHVCIGQTLAWVEMRLVLAKLLWSFDIEAPQDKSKLVVWEQLRTFLLIEKVPLMAVIKSREA